MVYIVDVGSFIVSGRVVERNLWRISIVVVDLDVIFLGLILYI